MANGILAICGTRTGRTHRWYHPRGTTALLNGSHRSRSSQHQHRTADAFRLLTGSHPTLYLISVNPPLGSSSSTHIQGKTVCWVVVSSCYSSLRLWKVVRCIAIIQLLCYYVSQGNPTDFCHSDRPTTTTLPPYYHLTTTTPPLFAQQHWPQSHR